MPLSRRIRRTGLTVLVLAAALVPPAGPSDCAAARPPKPNRAALGTGPRVERARPVLGDLLTIAAASRPTVTDTARAARAVEAALEEAVRLEAVLSPGGGASELARLNRAAPDDRFPCSDDLYAALDSALAVAAGTDGAWDPTAEPILAAWDARGRGRVPEPAEVAAARALTGWRMLLLDPGRRTVRFMRPGMGVALDAVSPGFVLDRAAGVLRGLGIVRARLELGGEVLAFTSYEPWTIRIPCPTADGGPGLRLALSDAACATVTQAGRGAVPPAGRVGTVVDPRTGRPVAGEASVTVVTRSACRARALAEALLVMGRDEAAAYVRAHPDLGVLWLEPLEADVRAWSWNLGTVEPEPGLRVEWMTHR